jgi:hypothetical protein
MSADEADGLKQYFGKYRGTVVLNIDPEQRGRIVAMVPDVLGMTPSTWAMPCLPVAGKFNGFYAIPKIGDGVWIEFEQGDPDYPIWVGSFWGSAVEVPLAALAVNPTNPTDPNIVIQSLLGHSLIISDMPPAPAPLVMPPVPTTGGIILRTAGGASIVVNDAGIFLNNGQGASVELISASVMINKLALVVT